MLNFFILCLLHATISAVEAGELGFPDQENIKYISGPKNPEDLYHIPETSWILASGMGPPGSLYLIDTDNKSWKILPFITPKYSDHPEKLYRNCSSPLKRSEFTPIGINIKLGENNEH